MFMTQEVSIEAGLGVARGFIVGGALIDGILEGVAQTARDQQAVQAIAIMGAEVRRLRAAVAAAEARAARAEVIARDTRTIADLETGRANRAEAIVGRVRQAAAEGRLVLTA